MMNKADEANWKVMKDTVEGIFRKNGTLFSFERIHSATYEIVLHKRGDILYDRLKTTVINQLAKNVCPKVKNATTDDILAASTIEWNDFTLAIKLIRDISMHMDTSYIKPANFVSIYDMGLNLFCEKVIKHREIREKLTAALLETIERERKDEVVDWGNMRAVLQMLLTLGFNKRTQYEDVFELPFLDVSRVHYNEVAENLLVEDDLCFYVRKVTKYLTDEKQHAEIYSDSITGEQVLQIVKDEMIAKQLKIVMEMKNNGMEIILRDDRVDDLRKLYEMTVLVPGGIDTLIGAMSKYLRNHGKSLIESNLNAVQMIQALSALKDQFDAFTEKACANDKNVRTAIREDFEFLFSVNPKIAEALASYIDDKLKKGNKSTLTDGQIEAFSDKAMILFKFLENKDIFEKYYKSYLAKRLLHDKSVSSDAENYLIAKLRTESGSDYAATLQQMLRDISLKEELSQEFRASVDSDNCIETVPTVLTTNTWTINSSTKFNVPRALTLAMNSFSKFYQTIHVGRKLTYSLMNSRGEISMNGFSRRYTFTAVAAQMAILTLFNEADSYTFQQIHTALKMESDLALNSLQPIVKSKLLIVTQGKLGEPNAILEFNSNFQNEKLKIDLTKSGGKAATQKERAQVDRQIEDGRKYEIQAAIVRIMKMRKTLKYSNLISELLDQLKSRFRPDVPSIKKSIAYLIESEYLKRKEEDFEVLEYLA